MFETFAIKMRIRAAVKGNRFLYFLQKVPLVGRMFGDYYYSDQLIKPLFNILGYVGSIVGSFFSKGIYFFVFVALMPILAFDGADRAPVYVSSLFFMNMLYGSFRHSRILNYDEDTYICVRLMHMEPRSYALSSLCEQYLLEAAAFLPGLIITALICGIDLMQAVCLYFMVFAFKVTAEALQLWLYKSFGFVWPKVLGIPVIVLGMIGFGYAVASPFLGWHLPLYRVLIHPIFITAVLAMGVLGAVYLARYDHYPYAVNVMNGKENLSADITDADITFGDVQLNDKETSDEAVKATAVTGKSGYDLLNALFVNRHRRILVRPVRIQTLIIWLVFAVFVVLRIAFPKVAFSFGEMLPDMMPGLVFACYLCNQSVERACRAMFYNCDIAMLRYGFYRAPKVVLQGFGARLKTMLRLNSVTIFSLCGCVLGLAVLCRSDTTPWAMAMYVLGLCSVMVMFTVHHLFMYYVFQPYTTDLNVKNPFFKIGNGIIYFISYICLETRVNVRIFAPVALGVSLLYTAVALLCVYKFSPKTFRVK